MNVSQLRISLLWFLIVFCYIIHGYYHVAALFYGADITQPNSSGTVPVGTHIFSLSIEILPLFIGLASLYVSKKGFQWFSWIFSMVLLLLNVFHLGSTLWKEFDDLRQVGLLTFILAANVLLVLDIKKQIKGNS